ncbi:MAG: F0F1 ATP synthase subunit gamma [Holosporales bacterium]|jgi:F-type H+-transporting ATPase subunit gamma|nr:F0F1 ATP synthase subunit gamma [Holosporales bacterium]
MENLKTIKNRIRTIDSIIKATNAMKMVSTAKLAKVNNSSKFSRRCCDVLREMILKAVNEAIFKDAIDQDSWLNRDVGKSLIVILSTDQGFCGSFHQSINEAAKKVAAEYNGAYIEIFGKKELHSTRRSMARPVDIAGPGRMLNAIAFSKAVAGIVMEYVIHHDVTDVLVISGKMKNMLSQNAVCTKILPIERRSVIDSECISIDGSWQEFIDSAFGMYISRLFVSIVTEHLVAEYSARVMAMDSSVRNANGIRDELSILYNNIRQAKITQELTEIVASVECIQ